MAETVKGPLPVLATVIVMVAERLVTMAPKASEPPTLMIRLFVSIRLEATDHMDMMFVLRALRANARTA